ENLRARGRERLRSRRTRRVAGVDLRALPAERLRERSARDESRIAVADRAAAGDELDVLPRHAGIGDRLARRLHAILDEVLSPLAPGMHADTEDRDVPHARSFAALRMTWSWRPLTSASISKSAFHPSWARASAPSA